jgi:hypothetical protein
MVGVIIFGSVRFLSKKVTKPKKKIKKKTETEPKPGQTDRFRFGFFRAKTGSNRFGSIFLVLARFSRFWLGFFRFGSVFSVWLGFLLVSVLFGFFDFLFIKPKPNRTGRFFQKFNRFNRFFFRFGFSVIFFLVFSV